MKAKSKVFRGNVEMRWGVELKLRRLGEYSLEIYNHPHTERSISLLHIWACKCDRLGEQLC